MKFPKLIPSWFSELPGSVKLAMIVVFIAWCTVMAISPGFMIFFTMLIGTVASGIRILHYFMEERGKR